MELKAVRIKVSTINSSSITFFRVGIGAKCLVKTVCLLVFSQLFSHNLF